MAGGGGGRRTEPVGDFTDDVVPFEAQRGGAERDVEVQIVGPAGGLLFEQGTVAGVVGESEELPGGGRLRTEIEEGPQAADRLVLSPRPLVRPDPLL